VLASFECVTLACGALGVQIEQFRRGIASFFHRPALGFFPLAAAQSMQRRGVRVAAEVAGNQMQMRHRHIQLVAAGEFQVEKFFGTLAHVHIG
jgi:hypothetical protein